MTDPLNDQARDAALSWIAADDAEAIVRVTTTRRTMTVTLGNGREIEVAVDEDLSGKGARFVRLWSLSPDEDAWVVRNWNRLIECWDEAKEADDV